MTRSKLTNSVNPFLPELSLASSLFSARRRRSRPPQGGGLPSFFSSLPPLLIHAHSSPRRRLWREIDRGEARRSTAISGEPGGDSTSNRYGSSSLFFLFLSLASDHRFEPCSRVPSSTVYLLFFWVSRLAAPVTFSDELLELR